ncbi:MAG: ABC transporter substrate-binding protein [Alphaproteobacteria bacterium]|nr:ABC transporter substrate-binding protein [Alphaproteobacteria bacterium]
MHAMEGIMRRRYVMALGGAVAALQQSGALAQSRARTPRVGYLWHAGSAEEEEPYFSALRDGFARLSYVEGRTVELIHRFPNEDPARFLAMAEELVAQRVDVLMGGGATAPFLKRATSRIPIVFMFVADPVGMGLADSLARPGGNATGLTNFGRDIAGKRLQILQQLVPGITRVGFVVNPSLPATRLYVDVMTDAAGRLGLSLHVFGANSIEEFEPTFDAMVKAGMQAVTLAQGGTAFQARALTPRLALARRLPLLSYSRETFEHGALASYGPSNVEAVIRSTVFVDKILRGAKPAEIPVEQPTTLELLINLKTAQALGLSIADHLRQAASEVVD